MPNPSTSGAGTVLFDADCPLCRSLAELAGRRSAGAIAFRSWQDFQASSVASPEVTAEELAKPATSLKVLVGATLLEGEHAWGYLLETHPDLGGLSWMAERLGLAKATARVMARSGDLLRRLCGRCPADARR